MMIVWLSWLNGRSVVIVVKLVGRWWSKVVRLWLPVMYYLDNDRMVIFVDGLVLLSDDMIVVRYQWLELIGNSLCHFLYSLNWGLRIPGRCFHL